MELGLNGAVLPQCLRVLGGVGQEGTSPSAYIGELQDFFCSDCAVLRLLSNQTSSSQEVSSPCFMPRNTPL